MGLVDYNSDSDSGSDSPAVPVPTPAAASKPSTKKPFQKLASSSGKILVSLPTASSTTADASTDDAPPAKRAKTSAGGGRFSNFSSFLPPPTKTAKPTARASLKTSSEAAFSRDSGDNVGDVGAGGMVLPPPKAPSLPEGQKAAEDVKLVGKATMFRPLSVARKPAKKKVAKMPAKDTQELKDAAVAAAVAPVPAVAEEPVPKAKVSLFSIGTEETEDVEPDLPDDTDTTSYEPMFTNDYSSVTSTYDPNATYSQPAPQYAGIPSSNPDSLTSIADDLNLSASARRELFGRDGKGGGKVVNFSMDREYAHNEALRASGEAVQHNPVRAIQPGKHSLKQIINTAQNQESALEENFAKNRATQREAGSRYGWR